MYGENIAYVEETFGRVLHGEGMYYERNMYCILVYKVIEELFNMLWMCVPEWGGGGGGDTGCGKWDYRGEKMWEVGL